MIRRNRMSATYLHGGAVNANTVSPYNIKFHDNVIKDWGQGTGPDGNPVASASGIVFVKGFGHEAIGNIFLGGGHLTTRNSPIGILVLATCEGDLTIRGNKFYDIGTLGGAAPILIQGARGVISHSNRFIESRSAPTGGAPDLRMQSPYTGSVGLGSVIGPDSFIGSFSSSIATAFTVGADNIVIQNGMHPNIMLPGFAADSGGNLHSGGVLIAPAFQRATPVNVTGSKASTVTLGQLASLLAASNQYSDSTT